MRDLSLTKSTLEYNRSKYEFKVQNIETTQW